MKILRLADKYDPHHPHTADRRRFGWRHLDLLHEGRTFLRRRGIETPWFGIMLHRIDQPDPGMDLHDHPWSFVSLILRGGYGEWAADTRSASDRPAWRYRQWRRWSVHPMPLHIAHRIVFTMPGTVTLVLRGPKVRRWGFYLPEGWVDWEDYDYDTRRPVSTGRDR